MRIGDTVTDSTGDRWEILKIDKAKRTVKMQDLQSNDKVTVSFKYFKAETGRLPTDPSNKRKRTK